MGRLLVDLVVAGVQWEEWEEWKTVGSQERFETTLESFHHPAYPSKKHLSNRLPQTNGTLMEICRWASSNRNYRSL